MKECIYYLESDPGKTYTYKELLERIRPNVDLVSDIVFSTDSKKDIITEKVQKIKSDSKAEFIKSKEFVEGAPIIKSSDTISIQEFIDSDSYTTATGIPLPKLDRDNYIQNKTKELIKERGISEDEAIKLAQDEVNNWDIISQDSKNLHILLSQGIFGGKSGSVTRFQDLVSSLAKKDSSFNKFIPIAADLYASVSTGMYKRMRSLHVGSNMVYNMNLIAELNDGLGKISGHVDYLMVDDRGRLHLFNIKSSTEDSQYWDSAKKEKYKHELALLKQMFASKGIDTRGMTLNLIPVRLNYATNDDGTTNYNVLTNVVPETRSREYTIDERTSRYAFSKYDRIAQHFISSRVDDSGITDAALDNANRTLELMFPEHGVKALGISKTIDQIIKEADKNGEIELSKDPDYYYTVTINDNVYKIKSPESPLKNKEIRDLYAKQMASLGMDTTIVTDRLATAIINSYKLGYPNFSKSSGFGYSSGYLERVLGKYIVPKIINNKKYYDWEFINNDTLLNANILMFQNVKTGQIDIISLSPYDLNQTMKFKRSTASTLGGCYAYDVSARGLPKATYGNIETMRAMALINEVARTLTNCKLGQIKVISPLNGGKGWEMSMTEANKTFNTLLGLALENNKDAKVDNNFSQSQFVDPFDILCKEYDSIIQSSSFDPSKKQDILDLNFTGWATKEDGRIQALADLLTGIENKLPNIKWLVEHPNRVNSVLSPDTKALVELYKAAATAYSYYNGDEPQIEQVYSSFRRLTTVSTRNPSRNVRMVSDIVVNAINNWSFKTVDQFAPIRQFIMDFYKAKGYTSLQNMTIGNQASLFDNLYEPTEDGSYKMIFRNPYTDHSLAPEEVIFLKKALFTFAKIRAEMHGKKFDFKGPDDPDLKEYINNPENHYFWVPLEKASKATTRQNLDKKVVSIKDKIVNFFRNPKQYVEQTLNKAMTPMDAEQAQEDISNMRLTNRFLSREANPATRASYLMQQPVEYFETNVENLLADFLSENIKHVEMNKALLRAKCILLRLNLLADDTQQDMSAFVQDIDDYLKLNVFNRSIMEPTSQKLISALTPLRTGVSKLYVAGNIVGFPRDIINGIINNYMRSFNKYGTDLNAGDITKAYYEVTTHMFTNAMSLNVMSLINRQFKISFDASNPGEAIKSGRSGFFNADEYAFATLRRPDFINRMTLFYAQCIHDGVQDALYDDNGKLGYNWRKDKRFAALAKGDKKDPNYAKQKALYLSKIRTYNQEHPDSQISYTDDLPMPYSDQEVASFKNLANSVYAYYDKALKAKLENQALGWIFGQFTTWMNGWMTNWFAKPGQYKDAKLKVVQAKDASGNLLYFDDKLQITTEKTNYPVLENVPDTVQGIFYTLWDGLDALYHGNFKKDIWQNPAQRANLNKFFSDLLVWLIMGTMYKLIFDPSYKEYKKSAASHSFIENALVETIYKAGLSSYDDFKGPIAAGEWLNQGVSPLMYQVPIQMIGSGFKVMTGDKTFNQFLYAYVPGVRSIKDTWNALDKES